MDPQTSPLTLRRWLLEQGIEIVVKPNGRSLRVWPGKAYRHLSNRTKAYIRQHTRELIADIAANPLPEATVVWQEPTGDAGPRVSTPEQVPVPAEASTAAPAPAPARDTRLDCPFCHAPCCGEGHHAYRTLHWRDPREIARRNADATQVMLRMLPYRHWSIE